MKYYFYKNFWGGGFTNQFVFLMDHLIAIHRQKEPSIVFLDCFKDDYHSEEMISPFSDMIDIDWLNTVIFPNIYIIDLYKIPKDVRFGWVVNGIQHQLDVDFLLPLIKENKTIYEINTTLIDPAYTCIKPFWITIESKQIYTELHELCGRILNISISNQNGKGIFIMNDNEFQNLFRYIPFIPKATVRGISLWDYTKINVIHVRNEEDSINVWGEQNGIDAHIYEEELNNKYISMITEYISKDSINIVLTARKHDNPVIKWLFENDYQIFLPFHVNVQGKREQMAIRDLQISTEFGNSVFIGYKKSSFSLLLSLRFKGNSIMIE